MLSKFETAQSFANHLNLSTRILIKDVVAVGDEHITTAPDSLGRYKDIVPRFTWLGIAITTNRLFRYYAEKKLKKPTTQLRSGELKEVFDRWVHLNKTNFAGEKITPFKRKSRRAQRKQR